MTIDLDLFIHPYLNVYMLTSFHNIVPSNISWKRKKTSSLLTLQRGIEMEHWYQMG